MESCAERLLTQSENHYNDCATALLDQSLVTDDRLIRPIKDDSKEERISCTNNAIRAETVKDHNIRGSPSNGRAPSMSPLAKMMTYCIVAAAIPSTICPLPVTVRKGVTVLKGATVPYIWSNSHYDFQHCGKPVVGRARRGYGDDYDDAINFNVDGVEEAERGEMSWAVAITSRVPSSPSSPRLCAGTLVSRRHVLSAAHYLATSIDIPVHPGYPLCNTTEYFDFIAWSEVKYGGECLSKRGSSCDDSMVAKYVKMNITLFPFFADDCSRGSDLVIIELEHDVDVPHACLPHLHDISGEDLKNSTVSPFHTFGWAIDNTEGIEYADRLHKSSSRWWRTDARTSGRLGCGSDDHHETRHRRNAPSSSVCVPSKKRAFAIGVLSSSSGCAKEEEQRESRFTDIRLFSASIDLAIGTVGKLPDEIIL